MTILALHSYSWLRSIEIRYRLIGSFILLSLLPLLISGYIAYAESSKAIQEKTRLFATEVVKQVAKNIKLQMAQIETDSEALVLSDPVQTALAHYASEKPAEQAQAGADITKILLDSYGSFSHINQKYFLDQQLRILDAQVFPQLGRSVVAFAARAPRLRGSPYWSMLDIGNGQKSIVMLRDIYFKGNSRLAGSLFLGIRQSHFASIFDDADLGGGSDLFVLDSRNGAVIIQPHPQSAGAAGAATNQALLAAIAHSMQRGQRTGFVPYAASTRDISLAAFTPIPGTSWFVVSTIPYNKLVAEAQSVRNKIVLIGLLCFISAIMLAYLISRSISQPLEKLVGMMRQAERGDYASRMAHEGRDELSVLAQQFNDMASKIGHQQEVLEERVAERTRDLEAANRKLAELSLTDGLTGIPNRRRFDAALVAELQRAARFRQPLALMMLDVDFFKLYNDYYGHLEGDNCLRSVARLLQTNARRASDMVARYGGEEFVLLAADTDIARALALAETIRAELAALAMQHEKSPLGCVTTSIGVAVLTPDEQQSPEAFIEMADKAMYRAKEQGRNRVVLA